MNILPPNMRFGAGQSVSRVEDQRLLTGQGRFVDDLADDNALWLAILRSPHAHARIVSIDTALAAKADGVVAIYTGEDLIADDIGTLPTLTIFKRTGGQPMSMAARRLLAHEVVRHVGEPVAAVVALSRAAAIDALEDIVVDYDVAPAVCDVRLAAEEGAPTVWPDAPDNVVAMQSYGDGPAVDAIFKSAAHVVSLDIMNQRLIPVAMEPRATQASIDAQTGRLTLRTQSQTPATTRDVLAEAILRRPKESVRVIVGDIGGGFGQKTGLYPEDGLVAYAAVKTARTVRWRGDRMEEFLGGTHGRDIATKADLALDAEGRILAFRAKSLANTGAYLSPTGAIIPLVLSPFVATGIYAIPAIHYDIKAIMTHCAPVGAYRGAGRPEAIYVIERLMDCAARALKMDPRAIRQLNAIPSAQMPFTTPIGQTYDSGDFGALLDRVSAAADWDGFAQRKQAAEAAGKLYGRGLASYIEWTGGNVLQDTASLFADSDGKIVLYSATQAMGQGLETAYTQMLADALDMPLDNIRIVQGDTDLAQGMGSVGSRSMFVGGSAVTVSAQALMEKAREKAADRLEAAQQDLDYAEGRFSIVGTDRSVSLGELAAQEQDGRLLVVSTAKVDGPSWPNGAHVAEVSIDPQTGVVTLERYVTFDDVGVAINPLLVRGQIHGGVAQGVGQALFEGAVYDEDGQMLTSSFMDYHVARAADLPSYQVSLFDGAPCRTNPLGAKGCGESGTVGATPTLVNAVMDALAPFGVNDIAMPLTPEKIWRACNGG